MKRIILCVISMFGFSGCMLDTTSISSGIGTITAIMSFLRLIGVIGVVTFALILPGCSGVKITEEYKKAGPDATSKSKGEIQVVRKYVNRQTGQSFFYIVPVEQKEVTK